MERSIILFKKKIFLKSNLNSSIILEIRKNFDYILKIIFLKKYRINFKIKNSNHFYQ
jgi:hypothetical protein